MIGAWRRWRRQRWLRRHRIPEDLWARVVAAALAHYGLDRGALHRLRELASVFLQEKAIVGADGLVVDDFMRAVIAAEACLLILNLDLADYDSVREIVVYPDSFLVTHETVDEAGVVHTVQRSLDGEAWDAGPVILGWADARPEARRPGEGRNVILHEFAHKLDMGNGVANGMPALHAGMDREAWTRAFSDAYAHLQAELARHRPPAIDPYAAENPAEFFAVVTETFFESPQILWQAYSEVYGQLRRYYRQDPLARLEAARSGRAP